MGDGSHVVHVRVDRTEIVSERISEFDFTQHPEIL